VCSSCERTQVLKSAEGGYSGDGDAQPPLSPASVKGQRTCMSSLLCGLSIGEERERARERERERERGLSVPAPSVATS
jgi:hypothetical protein